MYWATWPRYPEGWPGYLLETFTDLQKLLPGKKIPKPKMRVDEGIVLWLGTYNYSAHPLRLLDAWVSCDEQRDVNKQECPLYEKAIIHAALLVSDDDPEGKKPKTPKLDEAPFCRLVSGEISDCDELASLSKHHLEAGDTALSATKRVVAPSPEPPPRPRSFRKEDKVLVTWGRKREEVIPPFPPRPSRRRGAAPPPQAPALT